MSTSFDPRTYSQALFWKEKNHLISDAHEKLQTIAETIFSKYGEQCFRSFSLICVKNVSDCFSVAKKLRKVCKPHENQGFILGFLEEIEEISSISRESFQDLSTFLKMPLPELKNFEISSIKSSFPIHRATLNEKEEKFWMTYIVCRINQALSSKINESKINPIIPILLQSMGYILEEKICNLLKKKIDKISSTDFINAHIEKAILNIVLKKYPKYKENEQDLINFLEIFAIFLSRRTKKSVLLKLKKQKFSKNKEFDLKVYRIFLKNLNKKGEEKNLDLATKRERECQRTKSLLIHFANDYVGKKLPSFIGLEKSVKSVIVIAISELYHLLCCQKWVKHCIFSGTDAFLNEFENIIASSPNIEESERIEYGSPLAHIPLNEKLRLITRCAALSNAKNSSWLVKTTTRANASVVTLTLDPFKYIEKVIFGKRFHLDNAFIKIITRILDAIQN